MAQVRKRASAKHDLIGHFVYLAEDANIETAERFLSCAEDSFNDLASHPEIGPLVGTRNLELAGIRKWRVKDFENFLIFYRSVKKASIWSSLSKPMTRSAATSS
jgi:toxin ParE1/3/4